MVNPPTFDPAEVAEHFDACIKVIGSYAEAARDMGLKTAWAIQKWRQAGVPSDRVISFAARARFVRSPHHLRPDLYPHPADGLPERLRSLADLAAIEDILRPEERAQLTAAILNGPEAAMRAIESLDLEVGARLQLLRAAGVPEALS